MALPASCESHVCDTMRPLQEASLDPCQGNVQQHTLNPHKLIKKIRKVKTLSPTFNFLGLPLELRHEVYRHLFKASGKRHASKENPQTKVHLAILRTNTQVYMEAAEILYRETAIHIKNQVGVFTVSAFRYVGDKPAKTKLYPWETSFWHALVTKHPHGRWVFTSPWTIESNFDIRDIESWVRAIEAFGYRLLARYFPEEFRKENLPGKPVRHNHKLESKAFKYHKPSVDHRPPVAWGRYHILFDVFSRSYVSGSPACCVIDAANHLSFAARSFQPFAEYLALSGGLRSVKVLFRFNPDKFHDSDIEQHIEGISGILEVLSVLGNVKEAKIGFHVVKHKEAATMPNGEKEPCWRCKGRMEHIEALLRPLVLETEESMMGP